MLTRSYFPVSTIEQDSTIVRLCFRNEFLWFEKVTLPLNAVFIICCIVQNIPRLNCKNGFTAEVEFKEENLRSISLALLHMNCPNSSSLSVVRFCKYSFNFALDGSVSDSDLKIFNMNIPA